MTRRRSPSKAALRKPMSKVGSAENGLGFQEGRPSPSKAAGGMIGVCGAMATGLVVGRVLARPELETGEERRKTAWAGKEGVEWRPGRPTRATKS